MTHYEIFQEWYPSLMTSRFFDLQKKRTAKICNFWWNALARKISCSTQASVKSSKARSLSLVTFSQALESNLIQRKCKPYKILEPSNVTELQSFLGLVTYLAPYIPSLSEQTSPVRMLLLKDSEFQWNYEHRQAFQKIKQLICEATALTYFDPANAL